MKGKSLVVVGLILAALMITSVAYAKKGEVRFRVTYDDKGKPTPVMGATVVVRDTKGNIVAETITNEDGEATVTGLEKKTDYVAVATCPSGLHKGSKAFTTNGSGGCGLVPITVK